MLKEALQELLDTPSQGCVVNKWLLKQDPEVQETITKLIEHGVSFSSLYTVIVNNSENSIPFSKSSFFVHLKGTCPCQQKL